jgi:hypothetical protein
MNKKNVSKLWKIIQEADDYLLGEFYLASSHKATGNGDWEIRTMEQGFNNIPLINKTFLNY